MIETSLEELLAQRNEALARAEKAEKERDDARAYAKSLEDITSERVERGAASAMERGLAQARVERDKARKALEWARTAMTLRKEQHDAIAYHQRLANSSSADHWATAAREAEMCAGLMQDIIDGLGQPGAPTPPPLPEGAPPPSAS